MNVVAEPLPSTQNFSDLIQEIAWSLSLVVERTTLVGMGILSRVT